MEMSIDLSGKYAASASPHEVAIVGIWGTELILC